MTDPSLSADGSVLAFTSDAPDLALAHEVEVGRVVVGLPVGLSGADTQQTGEARAFAARLADAVDVPVELYDERFTTAIAARMSSHPTQRTSEDSRAAAVLLEDWLAHHHREVAG